MRKVAVLALLLPLVAAPGCPVHEFEVLMERASDGKVERELTVWTSDGETISAPAEDVLAAAQAAYGVAGEQVEGKHRFCGEFAGNLPADLVHEGLTNYGLMAITSTQMGNLLTYVERMPGQSKPVELVRRGEQFADTVVRALAAWAQQQPELKQQPERLEKLVAFLKTEFRDDVLNMLLMGWHAVTRLNTLEDCGSPADDDTKEKLWNSEAFRGVSYAAERGYLAPTEVSLPNEAVMKAVYGGVLRKAAEAMGYPAADPLPAPLSRLADPNDFQAAFEEGLKAIGVSSEEFQGLLNPAMPAIMGSDTNGRVVWRCKTEPIHTNGTWNAEQPELVWEARGRQGCEAPQLLFAVWAEPDEEFQRSHLGKVALAREPLYEYVDWLQELTAEQREKWDAFADTLRPGPELVGRLEAFRLPAPPTSMPATAPTTTPATAPATQPAEETPRGVRLILDALAGNGD